MFRLLLLISVTGWVAGQCGPENNRGTSDRKHWFWPGGRGDDDNYNDRSFDGDTRYQGYRRLETSVAAIARKLIGAGVLMEQFCSDHSNRALREVYGVEHFKLTVRLAEFHADSIQVIVRHRLVSILARDCDTDAEYAAVRILPDVVDAARAVWKLEGGVLSVMFPYNITPDTNLQSRCGRDVSNGVIVVPQSAPDIEYDRDYDLLLGDADFRRAIMRYLRLHEGSSRPGGQRGHKGRGHEDEDEDHEGRSHGGGGHEGVRSSGRSRGGNDSEEDDGTKEYVDDDKKPVDD